MFWRDALQKRAQESVLFELRDRLLDALHSDQPLTNPDELKRLLRIVEDVL